MKKVSSLISAFAPLPVMLSNFDIETVFLYLWAIKFQQLGVFAFVEMFIFLSILLVGLGYAWRKGALEWK